MAGGRLKEAWAHRELRGLLAGPETGEENGASGEPQEGARLQWRAGSSGGLEDPREHDMGEERPEGGVEKTPGVVAGVRRAMRTALDPSGSDSRSASASRGSTRPAGRCVQQRLTLRRLASMALDFRLGGRSVRVWWLEGSRVWPPADRETAREVVVGAAVSAVAAGPELPETLQGPSEAAAPRDAVAAGAEAGGLLHGVGSFLDLAEEMFSRLDEVPASGEALAGAVVDGARKCLAFPLAVPLSELGPRTRHLLQRLGGGRPLEEWELAVLQFSRTALGEALGALGGPSGESGGGPSHDALERLRYGVQALSHALGGSGRDRALEEAAGRIEPVVRAAAGEGDETTADGIIEAVLAGTDLRADWETTGWRLKDPPERTFGRDARASLEGLAAFHSNAFRAEQEALRVSLAGLCEGDRDTLEEAWYDRLGSLIGRFPSRGRNVVTPMLERLAQFPEPAAGPDPCVEGDGLPQAIEARSRVLDRLGPLLADQGLGSIHQTASLGFDDTLRSSCASLRDRLVSSRGSTFVSILGCLRRLLRLRLQRGDDTATHATIAEELVGTARALEALALEQVEGAGSGEQEWAGWPAVEAGVSLWLSVEQEGLHLHDRHPLPGAILDLLEMGLGHDDTGKTQALATRMLHGSGLPDGPHRQGLPGRATTIPL